MLCCHLFLVLFCAIRKEKALYLTVFVCVQKLEFVTEVLALKGFSEACFGERPPFRLFLMDSDSDEPLWSATIREGNRWTKLVWF